MKKEIWLALTCTFLLLMAFMVMAIVIDLSGANYLNPDNEVNWLTVIWGIVFGIAAYISASKTNTLYASTKKRRYAPKRKKA